MTENEKQSDIKFDQKNLREVQGTGKIQTLFDPKTTGLALRVTAGGAKSYYFVYRMGGRNTEKEWLKIGDFDTIQLNQAQKIARSHRSQVDMGVNPKMAALEAIERGKTVSEVADRFVDEYLSAHLKPKTQKDYKTSIERHIKPGIGKIPIKDLDSSHIAPWHRKMKDFPVAANRALATLSSICSQAEIWKLRPKRSNPCDEITRFEEEPRARDILPEEIQAIAKALKDIEGRYSPYAIAAIKVIILCAGRVNEVLNLRRDGKVFLHEGFARIDHKTSKKEGKKALELPPAAIQILRNLPVEDGNPFFFPGKIKGRGMPVSGIRKAWEKVRKLSKTPDLHIHDFRSFAASEGGSQKIDPKVLAKILGHTNERTLQRHYQKARDKDVAAAIAQTSRPIAEALGLDTGQEVKRSPEDQTDRKKTLLRRGFARVKR